MGMFFFYCKVAYLISNYSSKKEGIESPSLNSIGYKKRSSNAYKHVYPTRHERDSYDISDDESTGKKKKAGSY